MKLELEKEIIANFSELDLFYQKHQNYLGWLNLDELEKQIQPIKETAAFIRQNCSVFLVVGIGGSYLGAKAVIDALKPYFSDDKPEIIFVGNSLSSEYLVNLKEKIKDQEIIINYISKSGRTLETQVVFADLMKLMKDKYGDEELEKRIIYTTGNQAIVPENYSSFMIPEDIGGRFSVFSAVGLLPLAVAGIAIDKLLMGARKAGLEEAKKYASIRDNMEQEGKYIEAFVVYEPKLFYLIEWLKQLFAESLGKQKKGIMPIGLINTTDLHSLGQFLQEGRPFIFETTIGFTENEKIFVDEYQCYLHELNQIARKATIKAHQPTVPQVQIKNEKLNEETLGELMQFFMLCCMLGGFLRKINPFDQPGVEVYKKEITEELTKS